MAIERLGETAIARVSGPSWQPLKQLFLDISEVLLSAAPEGVGVLTTIYVKYQLNAQSNSPVFAVAWLKTSKQIVLGLALSDNVESPLLGPPPSGMKYKGLTKYMSFKPGDSVPGELGRLAHAAVECISRETTS